MLHLGLVGKDISHSKSKDVYVELLEQEIHYDLFDYKDEAQIPRLNYLFDRVQGLSITSPYKKHFLNQVVNQQNLSSINCIKKQGNEFFATNTDLLALREIIPQTIETFKPSEIFLLGDGSMADLTLQILKELGVSFIQKSRKQDEDLEQLNFEELSSKNGKKLVLNSCSRNFIYSGIITDEFVFLDYNYLFEPHKNYLEKSIFKYIDGLSLLKLQAKHALQFWGLSN